jgi:cell division protein ZipA
MDKELLRIVIIATGLMIIMGMLTWSYLRNKRAQNDIDFYDELEFNGQPHNPLTLNDEQTDNVTTKQPDDDDHFYDQEDAIYPGNDDDDNEPTTRVSAPAIIQFSLIAKADEGFNGIDIINAFGIVGLEFGSLKIFERLDENRLVDYGVACMTEPGTFPEKDLESFFTPGLVFFMQPSALDDPQAIFDDYIDTLQLLAIELDGIMLDHHRKELTDHTIQSLRQSL